MKKRIAILGSTGSIGVQTLQVAAALPEQIEVVALAAGSNDALLAQQIEMFRPQIAVMHDCEAAKRLRQRVGDQCEVFMGDEGLIMAATHPSVEIVVTSLVGIRGLLPTLAAIRAGKDIALANKETLVAAGAIVMEEVKKHNVRILPVDSEHSAIFQCLQGIEKHELTRLILTASGGPFRGFTQEQLRTVTRESVLKHPNWSMGKKITVDSATLMNKGLEVIEAKWLFDVPWHSIEVVVHPQSIVHSMIETRDGAILAQLGLPDMRVPIQYALTYPQRLANSFPRLNITSMGTLNFEPPAHSVFPALQLAYQAGSTGGTAPAVLNAANEKAVELFLQDRISFLSIVTLVTEVLERHIVISSPDMQTILMADGWAREEVQRILNEKGGEVH
jgi:1-deoxy-D-xylulose-5-phosphate reductoisomerase